MDRIVQENRMMQLVETGSPTGLSARLRWPFRSIGWIDLPILLVVIISLTSALVVVWRADTLTYDSVLFIRYARQLSEADWWRTDTTPSESFRSWLVQHSPLLEVIQQNSQHPGFALLVSGTQGVLKQILPDDPVLRWSMSAQMVSLVGLAVLILAVYRLGTELVGPAAGLTGGALVGLSPPMIRIGADALSDAPASAFLLVSAVFFARSLRTGMARPCLIGSIFASFGYLLRPEALQLALAMGLILGFSLFGELM